MLEVRDKLSLLVEEWACVTTVHDAFYRFDFATRRDSGALVAYAIKSMLVIALRCVSNEESSTRELRRINPNDQGRVD